MASVSDIHNFSDQFQYQLRKLGDADIDERDRRAIKELIRYQDTQRNLAASTSGARRWRRRSTLPRLSPDPTSKPTAVRIRNAENIVPGGFEPPSMANFGYPTRFRSNSLQRPL